MHNCWLVPELAVRIAEECTCTYEDSLQTGREGLSTLCALPKTCHAVHEPALNLIRFRLGTLSQLIRCLPEDLWTLYQSEYYDELVSDILLHPPSPYGAFSNHSASEAH